MEKPREPLQRGERFLTTERVIGYVRVSAAKHDEDLTRQRIPVQKYVAHHHWELVAIYPDIASGLNDRRPGLKTVLQTYRTGHINRGVITYEDRLARFGSHLREWVFSLWGVRMERVRPGCLTTGLNRT